MNAPGPFEAFRRLHAPGECLLLPNAWDYASAAALLALDFPAIATTSLGVAAAAGKADGFGTTRKETVALAARIAGLGLVSVDIEGGFTEDVAEVAELAAELAALGIVGINVEDSRGGTSLAPAEHVCALVREIKERVPGLFVNARTDTYWLDGAGASLNDTRRRIQAYADAGADGVFVPGVLEDAPIAALVAAVDAPLNVIFAPGKHDLVRLAALGVRRISLGGLLYRTALGAGLAAAQAIRAGLAPDGRTTLSYDEVQALLPK